MNICGGLLTVWRRLSYAQVIHKGGFICYIYYMASVKEKLAMAILMDDGPAIDRLIRAWASGHVTSTELDDCLSVQARIGAAEGTEMHAKKTVNVGAVKN